MAQVGSALSVLSNACFDVRYQNECWYVIATSNSFWAAGVQDVEKCTLPRFFSGAAKAGPPRTMAATAVSAKLNGVRVIVASLNHAWMSRMQSSSVRRFNLLRKEVLPLAGRLTRRSADRITDNCN